jgi:hypothetical protein
LNRREFIRSSSVALAAGTVLGNLPGIALGANPDDQLMRHRFGVDYVPSRNWYFCWNDWNAADIARDFDRIAEIGADHLRIMLIWPWFQPNPTPVSPVHLDRLEELMRLAAKRKLDVLVTLFNGWLSGFRFTPPYLESEAFYTSPKWAAVQDLYLGKVSERMVQHANFLGYDIGNEMDCCWPCQPPEGDAWMKRIFRRMHELCPDRIHVSGMDHGPWFGVNTCSPEALVAQQEIVPLHCWPYWTGAAKYSKPLEKPYTQLPAAMAALVRNYGNAPRKPIWLQEFGACNVEMPAADVPRWMELAVTGSIAQGVSWFTWWASHDVDRRFEFNSFEYDLGLLTVDNQIKEPGRMFKRLADTYRGKTVIIPDEPLRPPPAQRNPEATWQWLLEWMNWKP